LFESFRLVFISFWLETFGGHRSEQEEAKDTAGWIEEEEGSERCVGRECDIGGEREEGGRGWGKRRAGGRRGARRSTWVAL